MGAEVIASRTAPASQHLSQHHGKRTAEQGTAGRRGTAQRGDEMPGFEAALWMLLLFLVDKHVTLKKPVKIYLSACKCLECCSKSDRFWQKQKKRPSSRLRPGSDSCGHISPLSCAMLTFPHSEASRDMSQIKERDKKHTHSKETCSVALVFTDTHTALCSEITARRMIRRK